MKKILIITLISSSLLSACSSNLKPIQPIQDVPSLSKQLPPLEDFYTDKIDGKNNTNTNEESHIIDRQLENVGDSMTPDITTPSKSPSTNSDNVPQAITDYTSSIVLVNKTYYLPFDYKPDDLVVPNVRFSFEGNDEKKFLRKEAATALEDLFAAAQEEGLYLFAVSGYRSAARQKSIYEWNLQTKGEEHTNKYSAKPGHSEHQTGLAMDVSCHAIGFKLETTFENTPEGQWLKNNATHYGFIIRYPKDKTVITGYAYEPWHIRYVGEELAKLLEENNWTLDEYYEKNALTP